MFMKLGSLLFVKCRHRSVKSRAQRSNKSFQLFSFPANKERRQLWNSTVNRYYNERVHRKKQHASSIHTRI